MKITVEIDGVTHKAPIPGDRPHLELDMACPRCAAPAPLRVAGKGRHIESHDTYAADGFALCCRAPIGTIRTVVETLFGLEEDEAVLEGRPRVY